MEGIWSQGRTEDVNDVNASLEYQRVGTHALVFLSVHIGV